MKTLWLAGALMASLCISSVSLAKPQTKPTQPQYLFVMSAQSGMIKQSGKQYTLSLTNIDKHVLWFTDRPIRKAGFMPLKVFMNNWSKNFGGNPPNGAVVHAGMESNIMGKNQPMAIELTQPTYKANKVTFKIKGLSGSNMKSQSISDVKLFFDGCHTVSCAGGVGFGIVTTGA